MSSPARSLRAPGAAALAACLTLLPAPGLHAQPGQSPQGTPVEVEVRAIGATVPVGGTVVPHKDVTISAQLPGTVERIAGEEGDRFGRGALLVKLDEDQLQAQRRQALAAIASAEAAVRNAGVQYRRERQSPTQNNMFGQMMPSPMSNMFGGSGNRVDRQAQLYSHGIQVEQARSNLAQAQSRLQEIDTKFKDTRVVAPFDGVILHKHVEPGDTVQPGQPLLDFASDATLQVQVDVPSRLAGVLEPDASVPVRLDDMDKTVERARVSRVFPMADPTRHTVRVKLDLPQESAAAAGMYAEALLPDPTAGFGGRYPVIPASAVVWRGGLPFVYVARPGGGASLALLRLGDRVDADHVVVLTGLRGGETILDDPR